MGRRSAQVAIIAGLILCIGSPAFACGGLIGPRGSVNLLRTTTFAGYHAGVEHYVTSFNFTGRGGGRFGSIVPLPGVPSNVERGGDWTLQRLEREVTPPAPVALEAGFATAASADRAEVLIETRIDALDITVLKGGAIAIGEWAKENGFELPPDAPVVLKFYAERSPIFMAARFNTAAARARGQLPGDGTPIHLTIPTNNPWVPLRILALGKAAAERVNADVFLLTDRAPAMLPAPVAQADTSVTAGGLRLERSERASASLMKDLRVDKGGKWIPRSGMWLSFLRLDEKAGSLGYDLAIDASGRGAPSPRAAGFPVGLADAIPHSSAGAWVAFWLSVCVLAAFVLFRRITGQTTQA